MSMVLTLTWRRPISCQPFPGPTPPAAPRPPITAKCQGRAIDIQLSSNGGFILTRGMHEP